MTGRDQPETPLVSSALQNLSARGLIEQSTDLQAIDAALAGGVVSFYTGYDPTAPSLHLGHLLTMMAMRQMQRDGHRPIIIIGGATAMVGDPTGKSETRKMLSADTIAANIAAIRAQLSRFVHFDSGAANDAILLDNSAWLMSVGYVEFLRDYGRHFTVNRMIAAKTYRDRLEQELPLSFLEFNYQLFQAYDFLHLFRTYDCTLQLGGSDQWGNMVAGVELIRRVFAVEDDDPGSERPHTVAHCITYPLLTTSDGKKMGKTESGAVWLDPEMVSPFDYYQFWVGRADRDVGRLLDIFTELPLEARNRLRALTGADLREAKEALAYEATKLCHGEELAEQSRRASRQAFGGGGDWSAVPCVEIDAPSIKLVDLVVRPDIAAFKSKREARQRIEDGAVRLNGDAALDPNMSIDLSDPSCPELRLQAGKKRRFRVRFGA